MYEFKVGDTVKIIRDCSGTIAEEICTIHDGDNDGKHIGELWAWNKDSLGACHCKDNWELIPSNEKNKLGGTTMQKLTSKIKRILNPNLQLQYKAGLIDECGDLTSEGGEELKEIERDRFDEELTEKAKEIIKEAKEDK